MKEYIDLKELGIYLVPYFTEDEKKHKNVEVNPYSNEVFMPSLFDHGILNDKRYIPFDQSDKFFDKPEKQWINDVKILRENKYLLANDQGVRIIDVKMCPNNNLFVSKDSLIDWTYGLFLCLCQL